MKAPSKKDWVGKNVSCTDCGKQFEATQMRTFQKYEFIDASAAFAISIMASSYWEEVIPGRIRTNPLSDKLPEKKVLCPSCAHRFIYIHKPRSGRSPNESDFSSYWILGIILFILCFLAPLVFIILVIKGR